MDVRDEIVGPAAAGSNRLGVGIVTIVRLPAGEMRTGQYRVTLQKRGRYQLGPIRISSRFPLGIGERGQIISHFETIKSSERKMGEQTVRLSLSRKAKNILRLRFQAVKNPVGGVAITTLELSTTLNGSISNAATSIILTDGSEFPTAGYIVIEKVWTQADLTAGTITNPLLVGTYVNETIKYTGRTTHTLTGCTRGTSAPYKGQVLANTSANAHSSGVKVYGSYLATAVSSTVVVGPGASQTETLYNSLTFPLVSNATSAETGGGFQCTIGPVNDRA